MKKNKWLIHEILEFRLFREGEISVIELAFSFEYEHQLIHVMLTCKDVSSVRIKEMESHAAGSGIVTIDPVADGDDGRHFLIEEWEDQTFRFYCRQYEAAEEKEAQNGVAQT
ncbi:hypothetical protein ACPA1T_12250 [Bacillus amyloliquefaciens]|uniref:hypothetical protein n=1 Tax=Bacillus amyloliquefaciens TaxID=1390 RepID=UPI003C7819FA